MGWVRDRIALRDPGWLNANLGARAGLSTLAAWYATHLAFTITSAQVRPAAMVYAAAVSFFCYFLVAEHRFAPRGRITLLAVVPAMAAAVVSLVLGDVTWLAWLLLLGLMYASFAVRPRSQAVGTLILIGVMSLNFTASTGVTTDNVGWYFIASLVGSGMAYAGQFVFYPQHEQDALRQVCRTMLDHGRSIGKAIDRQLGSAGRHQPSSLPLKLQMVRASQRAIDDRLAQVEHRGPEMRTLATEFRLAAYAFGRGTTLLADATATLATLGEPVPPQVAERMRVALGTWSAVLEGHEADAAAKPGFSWTHVRELADQSPAAPWRDAVLELVVGGAQSAQAAWQLYALNNDIVARIDRPEPTPPPARTTTPPARPGQSPGDRSPAMTLGIQATTATGIAMLVSWLVGLDHPNWAFLGAFAVVAGSAGESIRRIGFRIAGTILGSLVGILVYQALDPFGFPAPWLIAACIAAVIFARPWSYTVMVAALTAGLTVAFVAVGGSGPTLLVERSLSTVIGAVIGGLVTCFVLPIRIEHHFIRAVVGYLQAVDAYLAASSEWIDGTVDIAVPRERLLVTATVAKTIETTLPAVAAEFNPMTHARSAIARNGVKLLAVDRAIQQFAAAMDETGNDVAAHAPLPLVRDAISQSRRAVDAILGEFSGGDTAHDMEPSLTAVSPLSQGSDVFPDGPERRLTRSAFAILLSVADIEGSIVRTDQPHN